jgi:uncharacterized protein involved in cysteine biosynthesis
MQNAEHSTQRLAPTRLGLVPRCPHCGTRFLDEESTNCSECGAHPASTEVQAKLVGPGSSQREFFRGVRYLPRGAWKALSSPHLWPTLAIALVLNVVFVIGVETIMIPALENWLKYTTLPDALSQWTGAMRIFKHLATFLGWTVRVAGFFAIPGLTAWVLSTPPFRIIFAVLATQVSEKLERDFVHGSPQPTSFEIFKLHRSMSAAVLSALVLTIAEAVLYGLLIPVALIPVVGTFAWLVLPRAIFSGLDQTDPTLCRKVYHPGEKIALWWAYRWRILGFGCAFFFFLGTPIFNAFVFPAAAAGGALLYLELDRK